jgi:ABC-2 type transport system permease protein
MKYFSVRNRAILREMVRADFKMKYQGSVLGYLWSLLKPLLMFLVLYVVFAVIFKVGKDIPNFPIYLLLGIVLWSFFAETTQNGLQAVVAREDLIKKIKIPRWIVIISTSASSLINLALNLVVVVAFALITGMQFTFSAVLLLIFIFEIYIFAVGISLFLSAAYVKYRDVSYIWEVVIQAGFYATPILYPIAMITDQMLQKIVILNPVAHAIQGARYAFVTPETVTIGSIYGVSYMFLVPITIAAVILVAGVLYFKKQSKYFAENL